MAKKVTVGDIIVHRNSGKLLGYVVEDSGIVLTYRDEKDQKGIATHAEVRKFKGAL